MNSVLTFLESNRERLDLEQYGIQGPLTSVLLTPRFHASSHVVFLVLPKGSPDPVLVAKVPRCAGSRGSIEREAANLRAIQALRPGGFDSIPRLVTYEDYCGYPLLIETALVGQPLTPTAIRGQLDAHCQTVTAWLIDLQSAQHSHARERDGWLEEWVGTPLSYLEQCFPLSHEEREMLDRTCALAAALDNGNPMPAFEHGDLANPNLLLLRGGALGVLDWELATPRGLPLADLFFFLTFASFARASAHRLNEYLDAFSSAFFTRTAWTQPYVSQYVSQFRLSPELLTSTFVLTWLRYVVNLLRRLGSPGGRPGLEAETVQWLRSNRYFALWKYAVENLDRLTWDQVEKK